MRNEVLAKILMKLGFSVEVGEQPTRQQKKYSAPKIESAPNRMSQKKRRQRARWKS